MAGDATGLAAVARILGSDQVDGIQILKEQPVTVGIRRAGKWSWVGGATAALALQQAERVLKGLPLIDSGASL